MKPFKPKNNFIVIPFYLFKEINSKPERERYYGRDPSEEDKAMFPWLGETNDSKLIIRYYGVQIGDAEINNCTYCHIPVSFQISLDLMNPCSGEVVDNFLDIDNLLSSSKEITQFVG
jgi:hypothetical protein